MKNLLSKIVPYAMFLVMTAALLFFIMLMQDNRQQQVFLKKHEFSTKNPHYHNGQHYFDQQLWICLNNNLANYNCLFNVEKKNPGDDEIVKDFFSNLNQLTTYNDVISYIQCIKLKDTSILTCILTSFNQCKDIQVDDSKDITNLYISLQNAQCFCKAQTSDISRIKELEQSGQTTLPAMKNWIQSKGLSANNPFWQCYLDSINQVSSGTFTAKPTTSLERPTPFGYDVLDTCYNTQKCFDKMKLPDQEKEKVLRQQIQTSQSINQLQKVVQANKDDNSLTGDYWGCVQGCVKSTFPPVKEVTNAKIDSTCFNSKMNANKCYELLEFSDYQQKNYPNFFNYIQNTATCFDDVLNYVQSLPSANDDFLPCVQKSINSCKPAKPVNFGNQQFDQCLEAQYCYGKMRLQDQDKDKSLRDQIKISQNVAQLQKLIQTNKDDNALTGDYWNCLQGCAKSTFSQPKDFSNENLDSACLNQKTNANKCYEQMSLADYNQENYPNFYNQITNSKTYIEVLNYLKQYTLKDDQFFTCIFKSINQCFPQKPAPFGLSTLDNCYDNNNCYAKMKIQDSDKEKELRDQIKTSQSVSQLQKGIQTNKEDKSLTSEYWTCVQGCVNQAFQKPSDITNQKVDSACFNSKMVANKCYDQLTITDYSPSNYPAFYSYIQNSAQNLVDCSSFIQKISAKDDQFFTCTIKSLNLCSPQKPAPIGYQPFDSCYDSYSCYDLMRGADQDKEKTLREQVKSSQSASQLLKTIQTNKDDLALSSQYWSCLLNCAQQAFPLSKDVSNQKLDSTCFNTKAKANKCYDSMVFKDYNQENYQSFYNEIQVTANNFDDSIAFIKQLSSKDDAFFTCILNSINQCKPQKPTPFGLSSLDNCYDSQNCYSKMKMVDQDKEKSLRDQIKSSQSVSQLQKGVQTNKDDTSLTVDYWKCLQGCTQSSFQSPQDVSNQNLDYKCINLQISTNKCYETMQLKDYSTENYPAFYTYIQSSAQNINDVQSYVSKLSNKDDPFFACLTKSLSACAPQKPTPFGYQPLDSCIDTQNCFIKMKLVDQEKDKTLREQIKISQSVSQLLKGIQNNKDDTSLTTQYWSCLQGCVQQTFKQPTDLTTSKIDSACLNSKMTENKCYDAMQMNDYNKENYPAFYNYMQNTAQSFDDAEKQVKQTGAKSDPFFTCTSKAINACNCFYSGNEPYKPKDFNNPPQCIEEAWSSVNCESYLVNQNDYQFDCLVKSYLNSNQFNVDGVKQYINDKGWDKTNKFINCVYSRFALSAKGIC